MTRAGAITVGVISDTHGLVRPQALSALAGVSQIIHAGDIGGPEVLAALRQIAPVTAVRGNNDRGPWGDTLPVTAVVQVAGQSFYVIHDIGELDLDPGAAGFTAVVAGHSHKPLCELRGGILYFNPGSAGPRRFTLPIAVGRLRVGPGDALAGEIVPLDLNDSGP